MQPENTTPTAPKLTEGQKLAGCYILTRELSSQGGFSVWLAHDEVLGKDVSLHFLPDAVKNDLRAVAEIRQEVKRNRQLIHPSILRVYDFVEDGPVAAVSMDRIDGDSLAAMLRKNGPLSPDAAQPVLESLGATLDDAHRVNLFHRDLSPANLYLKPGGGVLVANFGISRSMRDALERARLGTPESLHLAGMSPQQIDGQPATKADDTYGLGALAFEILTGRPAFSGPDIVPKIRAEMPKTLAATATPATTGWEAFVAGCLAKRPEQRPTGCAAAVKLITTPATAPAPVAAAQPLFAPAVAAATAPAPALTSPTADAPTPEPERKNGPKLADVLRERAAAASHGAAAPPATPTPANTPVPKAPEPTPLPAFENATEKPTEKPTERPPQKMDAKSLGLPPMPPVPAKANAGPKADIPENFPEQVRPKSKVPLILIGAAIVGLGAFVIKKTKTPDSMADANRAVENLGSPEAGTFPPTEPAKTEQPNTDPKGTPTDIPPLPPGNTTPVEPIAPLPPGNSTATTEPPPALPPGNTQPIAVAPLPPGDSKVAKIPPLPDPKADPKTPTTPPNTTAAAPKNTTPPGTPKNADSPDLPKSDNTITVAPNDLIAANVSAKAAPTPRAGKRPLIGSDPAAKPAATPPPKTADKPATNTANAPANKVPANTPPANTQPNVPPLPPTATPPPVKPAGTPATTPTGVALKLPTIPAAPPKLAIPANATPAQLDALLADRVKAETDFQAATLLAEQAEQESIHIAESAAKEKQALEKKIEERRKTLTPIITQGAALLTDLKKREEAAAKAEAAAIEAQKAAAEAKKALDEMNQTGGAKLTAAKQAEEELKTLGLEITTKAKQAEESAKAKTQTATMREQISFALLQLGKDKAELGKAIAAAKNNAASAAKMKNAARIEELKKLAAPIEAENAKFSASIANLRKELGAAGETAAQSLATQVTANNAKLKPILAEIASLASGAAPAQTPPPPVLPVEAKPTPPPTGAATPPPVSPTPPPPPAAVGNKVSGLGHNFVKIRDVDFSTHLITRKQFETFAKEKNLQNGAWETPGFKQGDDHPVVHVTWKEADAFCKWLTERDRKAGILKAGEVYRLPSDLEWSAAVGLPPEKGATPEERDLKEDIYPWGLDWPPPAGAGNYAGEETGSDARLEGYRDEFQWTAPVGKFKPNAFGLYDMGGNVWQWTADFFDDSKEHKALRGGSWYNGSVKLALNASCRYKAPPDASNDTYGFRIVRAKAGK